MYRLIDKFLPTHTSRPRYGEMKLKLLAGPVAKQRLPTLQPERF